MKFYFNFSQSVCSSEMLKFGLVNISDAHVHDWVESIMSELTSNTAKTTATELTYCICLRHVSVLDSVLDHCTTSDKSNVCNVWWQGIKLYV